MSTAAPPRRALVVEDDEDISSLIEFTLSTQGFEVHTASTGLAALEEVKQFDPDLITLDVGLPGIDGIETCRRIRESSDVYIVMITARDDEIDRLMGLETGADDYLSKPFSVRELKARVNALFRRPRRGFAATAETDGEAGGAAGSVAASVTDHELLEHGPLRVDVDGRRAFKATDELQLTRTEFDLLTELMRTPARVWTREALLRSVWGTEWASDTHLVEVHIGNLRRKLGSPASGTGGFVKTVRGVGYRMESL